MYNYIEAMKNDIRDYILDECETGQFADRDEMEETLNEFLRHL